MKKPRVSIVREVAHGTAGYTHTFTSYQAHRADGLLIYSGWDWAEAMHRANAEAKRAAREAMHVCSSAALLSGVVRAGELVCGHGVHLKVGDTVRTAGGHTLTVKGHHRSARKPLFGFLGATTDLFSTTTAVPGTR